MTDLLKDLHVALASAGIPIDGVALLDPIAKQIRIDFQDSATPEQQAQAQTLVAAFDWSDEAQAERDQLAARTAAKTLLAGTDETGKVLRALLSALLDQLNTVREALPTPLPKVELVDLHEAVLATVDAGKADVPPEKP